MVWWKRDVFGIANGGDLSKTFSNALKNRLKHRGRQNTGIRVVARAMVAVIKRDRANVMLCAVAEGMARQGGAERFEGCIMRDAA